MFNNINLNLYKDFYLVCKYGSINKAAKESYTSPPAISKSIKKLESELNRQLFYRNSDGMMLTSYGEKLLFYVEESFNSLNVAERTLVEEDTLKKGSLNIGIPSNIGSFFLFDNLIKFHNEYPNIDVTVNVDGKTENVKLQMTSDDIRTVENNLARFKNSMREVSKDKINIEYETYVIKKPIKTLSYDEENGYYVSAEDVYEYIDSYVKKNMYDHIYVAFRMADKQKGNDTLVNDWIGLGGMDYYSIGFSNIRMPDDRNNLAYEFNYRVNTFPEEVFIHEFLHTLERNAKEYGYERPELHDYAKYGYTEDKKQGLRKWYTDYINKEISYNGTKIGLPEEILRCKPCHENNFKYATQVAAFKEPSNIIEIIQSIFSKITRLFEYRSNKIETE